MSELEKAAREFRDRCYESNIKGGLDYPFDGTDMTNAFVAGAEWQAKQSPWISTDERFPENKETVLVSSQIYGKIVLTWDELGMIWFHPESEDIYCDWNKVDCWMPIPE